MGLSEDNQNLSTSILKSELRMGKILKLYELPILTILLKEAHHNFTEVKIEQ